jgi:hypothetical protein
MINSTKTDDTELTWTTKWLAQTTITDDPVGDLIADMQRDVRQGVTIPSFNNIGDMRAVLCSRNACDEALATVPAAWRRYKRWRDRQAFRCIPLTASGRRG